MTTINKNSEILFIYDAKLTNPNGDMDNENKPRMDYDTETNLVSDVRFKRYIRDYFEDHLNLPVFITEKAKTAEEHVKSILGRTPSKDKPITQEDIKKIKNQCVDIRIFGAVFGTAGGNDHLTGPVQFNWGYSLNKVQLCDSNTITSSFSSGEGVGKDYKVKYSLIAFSGSINAVTAKGTDLSDEDIQIFDKAMLVSIPASRTRSKNNQTPRVYIRVQMNDATFFLKDMREYVKFDPKVDEYKIDSVDQYKLDIIEIVKYLKGFESKIEKVFCWKDDKIEVIGWEDLPKKELLTQY